MLWFFERGPERRRVETHFCKESCTYELRVIADGVEALETFEDAEAFGARLRELEDQFSCEQWTQAGPPRLLHRPKPSQA